MSLPQIFTASNFACLIFYETPLTPVYSHTAYTHPILSVPIFPHGALSSGHPVTTHTHKYTHIAETKPHVTTERHEMLVFESKDAYLCFFHFVYFSS